jgi:hypothetical protein
MAADPVCETMLVVEMLAARQSGVSAGKAANISVATPIAAERIGA